MHVTDAEIRGALDGLNLGLNIGVWSSKISNLKISQILDLYYSSRGVLNNTMRACNRKLLRENYAATPALTVQVAAVTPLLDEVSTGQVSIDRSKFTDLAQSAVDSFNVYLGNLVLRF